MGISCAFSEQKNRTNFFSAAASQRLVSPSHPPAAAVSVMSAAFWNSQRLETAACWVTGVCQAAVRTHQREASSVALCDKLDFQKWQRACATVLALHWKHFSILMRFYAFDEVASEHELRVSYVIMYLYSKLLVDFRTLLPVSTWRKIHNALFLAVLYLYVIVFFFFSSCFSTNNENETKETNNKK